MSVEDKILYDKELAEDAQAIAEAVTEYLVDNEKITRTSFCLFLVDHRTGTVKYISDMAHQDAMGVLRYWVNRDNQ